MHILIEDFMFFPQHNEKGPIVYWRYLPMVVYLMPTVMQILRGFVPV